jgi:hypothetical protein
MGFNHILLLFYCLLIIFSYYFTQKQTRRRCSLLRAVRTGTLVQDIRARYRGDLGRSACGFQTAGDQTEGPGDAPRYVICYVF